MTLRISQRMKIERKEKPTLTDTQKEILITELKVKLA